MRTPFRRAESKLFELLDYPLFTAVGKSVSDVKQARDWDEAVHSALSAKWERCTLMARNRLQRLVEELNWNRTSEWNLLCQNLQPQLMESLTARFDSFPQALRIQGQVAWDFSQICLETHYSDLVTPPFFVPLLDPWYQKGHFPCGWTGTAFPDNWDGNITNGKLVVF